MAATPETHVRPARSVRYGVAMSLLLGGGIPLLPPPASRARLTLRNRRIFEKSGIVMLEYDVVRD